METPAYPPEDADADGTPEPTMGWGGRVAIAAVMVLLAIIVVLHLTSVVGPASH